MARQRRDGSFELSRWRTLFVRFVEQQILSKPRRPFSTSPSVSRDVDEETTRENYLASESPSSVDQAQIARSIRNYHKVCPGLSADPSNDGDWAMEANRLAPKVPSCSNDFLESRSREGENFVREIIILFY